MAQIKEVCSDCGILRYIINKKYILCTECNYKRTHKGKSRYEVYKEKEKIPKKKVKVIKKFSSKRSEKEREYILTCKKIDQEREPVCEGCGRGDRSLSHSHLLSKYSREDLIAEERNIRLHCFYVTGNCHDKWEKGDPKEIVNMLDFKENLQYIKEVDIDEYNKIVASFEFEGIPI